jgi:hypothetical protein
VFLSLGYPSHFSNGLLRCSFSCEDIVGIDLVVTTVGSL